MRLRHIDMNIIGNSCTTVVPTRTLRAGFTLFEASVVVVLTTLLVSGAVTVVLKTETNMTDEMLVTQLEQSAERIMSRFEEELRGADPGTLQPTVLDGSTWVVYRKVAGFSSGQTVLTQQRALGLFWNESTTGSLYLYPNFYTTPIRIADNIVALRFHAATNGVLMKMTVGLTNREGKLETRDFSRQISFRNDAATTYTIAPLSKDVSVYETTEPITK